MFITKISIIFLSPIKYLDQILNLLKWSNYCFRENVIFYSFLSDVNDVSKSIQNRFS